MIGSIFPREVKFFELFRNQGDLLVEGSEALKAMLKDLGRAEDHARNLEDIEHKSDEATRRAIDLVHHTFITPIDREDIILLAGRLDDILDFTEAAGQLLHLYDIKKSNEALEELADISLRCVKHVREAVGLVENLKNAPQILKLCREIHKCENEADSAQRRGLAKLFREENDVKTLIKLKEIYELMERITDCCEDVANVIEGIVVEYA